MTKISLVLFGALAFGAASTVSAQTLGALNTDAVKKPDTAVLGNLAARLNRAKSAPTPTQTQPTQTPTTQSFATGFAPSGQRLTLDAFADALGKTKDERDGLREVLQSVFKAYETEAEKSGIANDVAAAMAFCVAADYSAFHGGEEVSETAMDALTTQLRDALDTDAMRAAPDLDKQKLYEFYIQMGGFTGAMQQLGASEKDAVMQKSARQLGAEGLKGIFHIEANRIRITAKGLAITPVAAATQTTQKPTVLVGGIGTNDISYSVPAGWTETRSAGAITLFHNGGNEVSNTCQVAIIPGFAKSGSLADTVQTIWRDNVLKNYTQRDEPFPYLSQLPNGLSYALASRDVKNKSNDADYHVAAYVFDAGKSVVLVLVTYWKTVYIDDTLSKPIVQLLDSLKIRGAPLNQPMLTRADIVGKWAASDTESASYVNSSGGYVGDASSMTSEQYVFRADGTFTHFLFAMTGNFHVKENQAGRYVIKKNTIVLHESGAAGRVLVKQFFGRNSDGEKTVIRFGDERIRHELIDENYTDANFHLTK